MISEKYYKSPTLDKICPTIQREHDHLSVLPHNEQNKNMYAAPCV